MKRVAPYLMIAVFLMAGFIIYDQIFDSRDVEIAKLEQVIETEKTLITKKTRVIADLQCANNEIKIQVIGLTEELEQAIARIKKHKTFTPVASPTNDDCLREYKILVSSYLDLQHPAADIDGALNICIRKSDSQARSIKIHEQTEKEYAEQVSRLTNLTDLSLKTLKVYRKNALRSKIITAMVAIVAGYVAGKAF